MRGFFPRLGFARQLRFVECEVRGVAHDAVGVQDVALAEKQQIAGHQLSGWNFLRMSVAQNSRPRRHGARELLECALRTRLHQHVHAQNRNDDGRQHGRFMQLAKQQVK